MLHDNLEKKYTILMMVKGLLGSLIFIMSGYWFAGAIEFMQKESITFFAGIGKVLRNPLGKYFNSYSPIFMAFAFLLFEVLFFLYMVYHKKKGFDAEMQDVSVCSETEASMEDTKSNDSLKNIFHNKESGITQGEVSGVNAQIFVLQNEFKSEQDASSNIGYQDETSVKKAVFDNEMVMELLTEYDMEQITAMLNVTTYIDDVSIDMLKRMFNADMSASDISAYIEIFYG